MAFLSEGVESPFPRGVLIILVFELGGKKLQIFVHGGSQKKVSEGVTFSEKCQNKLSEGVKWVKKAVRGGKIDKKLFTGGKISDKNCLRGVKLDRTVRGVTRKKNVQGGKKILFCVRGG